MSESKAKALQKELSFEYPHIAKVSPEQIAKAQEFANGYKDFLNRSKTEREVVNEVVKLLEANGYTVFDPKKTYKAGDKIYKVNRKKAILASTIGSEPIKEGIRINGAHIDSPRIDLRPNPLYEKSEISYFKTHYYGGIRKYQWATIPLSMHGVIFKKDGSFVEINLGEGEDDPVFYISDLLPHLSSKQDQRKLSEGIKGEELNIFLGTLPFDDTDDVKDSVKLKTLEILHNMYGITERDFARAEIEFVPATKARDIGLDRSLLGGYGHDDRVCAYPAIIAEIEAKNPRYTTLTILADKEEIGSAGNTGLHSHFVYDFIEYLSECFGADVKEVCEKSACLSSDVNAAFDPTFPDVFEPKNSSYLNRGCVLTKYTGSRGKAGSSDASAEFMNKVISIMEANDVHWQVGELGALDIGGGGTIAQYVAMMNIDVVDLGVPVISMHSPYEVISKLDLYNTYLAFKAFYK
ncbi:aminopeptidase [Lachnoanaerobaculum sp. Marseille-Q4761]|uniref:aminopeptidase n=1 Tax=Lachnoanaerobaculum sp. Marseille-Q4761 TaxID=2819511 RepID=UPI001AA1B65A|nr:aminopeptidase [Lachnoanaerobaculum sp. Marseille-Q4761]MBO1869564.1 aminopeptidase [Lachnoanaerobaculum sp. Marseille-Q4761]